ncbi:MAG: hypothetical protein U5R06_21150 [candidate division KSB1 bacterium]|nr:hypothetical protein [candidate division KSB1 bacterium]
MNKRYFYLVFAGLVAIHVLMISNMRLLPFIDLPMHLASATIERYIDSPDNFFSNFFKFDSFWFQPNSFSHFFMSSSVFPSVEFAKDVFFTLYILLFTISLLIFIRQLKGNVWFALLAFLYLYNYSVNWGFTGYTLGIPLTMFAFILHYKFIIKDKKIYGYILSVYMLFLYSVHGLIMLFALLCMMVNHFYLLRFSFRRAVREFWVYLPAILIVLIWYAYSGHDSLGETGAPFVRRVGHYYKSIYLKTFFERLGFLHWDNNFLFARDKGKWAGIAFSVFTLAVSLYNIKKINRIIGNELERKKYAYIIILIMMSLLTLLTMFQIVGSFYYTLYRFSVFVFIGVILLGSMLTAKIHLKYRIVMISAIVLIHLFLWYGHFNQFQIENKSFDRSLFNGIKKDKVLSFILYDARYKRMITYNHFANYHIIWNKGIAINKMVDFPSPWRLRRNASTKKLPPYDPYTFKHNYQGGYEHTDFLLIRGTIPEKDVEKIKPFFQLIRCRPPYYLYQNRNVQNSVK